jgi:hypothetical protein
LTEGTICVSRILKGGEFDRSNQHNGKDLRQLISVEFARQRLWHPSDREFVMRSRVLADKLLNLNMQRALTRRAH